MELHDHGLAADLEVLVRAGADRRQSLRWLLAGGAACLPLFGCGGGSTQDAGASATVPAGASPPATATPATGAASCAVLPEEIAGPFPADGTNTNRGGVVNALTLSGIVRSDIRSSVGGAVGTAAGVPLTITLQLVNVNGGCASLAGYVVYIWHCTQDGLYSLYSSGVTEQNYLRGVQVSDSNGNLSFRTIFPGCYPGRMPHVHLEVYPSLAAATSAANRLRTSQFTFPLQTLNQVYASSGYSSSVANLAQISYATDMVFNDGTSLQMADMSGNLADGYVATLRVGIRV